MNFIGSPQMGQRGGVDVSENMPRKIGPLARRANSGDIHKERTASAPPALPTRDGVVTTPNPPPRSASRSTSRVLHLEPVDGARTLPRTPREARVMKTTWGWSANLTRSIVLRDGTRLVTLGDVRAFILKQPEHIQERGSWQHAAELLILAAERGGSIEAATTQIEDALFLEARYARQWH
jgi:hypothetical protein